MNRSDFALWACALLVTVVFTPAAFAEIADSKHNLTATGPGSVRVSVPAGLCVFCHAPHNAKPSVGLWNRDLPAVTYTPYESSTQIAKPGQPTGSSRLCLSCHDGTTALGNIRAGSTGGQSLGPLTGPTVLGTNLSTDHPTSFVYDGALAAARGTLVTPASLPRAIHLDGAGQMQCTSCHDPHTTEHPKFLRMEMQNGALCLACHAPAYWQTATHSASTKIWNGVAPNPWPPDGFLTVGQNACMSCHRPHAAAHGPRLLAQDVERANCNVCHNGNVAAKNLEAEFSKVYRHPVDGSNWIHDPKENPATAPRHVTCADCHNPHATTDASAPAPMVSGPLKGVSGMTRSGTMIAEAQYEYEVCFKCHAAAPPKTLGVTRQSRTRNIRLKLEATNSSYHPVEGVGRHTTIGGLLSPYTATSLITCTDCHNNNAWTTGSDAPRGPHGSVYPAILERQYQTNDPTVYSNASYSMCFKCHSSTYLTGGSKFLHAKHNGAQAACAVCHDAHGSSTGEHLIDFMLRDRTGKAVVTPYNNTIAYVTTSPVSGRGTCTLTCHGKAHNSASYP